MAIPTSNVSLLAAREDVSLSPEGGMAGVFQFYRRIPQSTDSGPIALKADLAGSCMGMQSYTGEADMSTGTAGWKKDPRLGKRDQCFGNPQDSMSQLDSYSCYQTTNSGMWSTRIQVRHRNLYSNDVGFLTRHWAYAPDGGEITLNYRIGSGSSDAGLSPKYQVEIVGYADGPAEGAQSMLGYKIASSSNTNKEFTLGPFDTAGYPHIMITMCLFTGGRNDNMLRRCHIHYGNVRADIS